MTNPLPHSGLSPRAFVGMMASLMAVGALGTDIMLPALPTIAKAMHVTVENQQQWIVASYVLGMGSTQLIFGPLADHFGRKPVLLFGLILYVLTSFAVVFAPSFGILLAARVMQGMASAAPRVLVSSIVRDCYAGRQMARVMSLAFMVFLSVPIIAPSIGELILHVFGAWQMVFILLALYSILVTFWVWRKMPETLAPADRRSLRISSILGGFAIVLRNRTSLGYTLALTALFGALMGFIDSSQQIFAEALHAPHQFTLVFAVAAAGMGVGAYFNSRIVERFGSRLVSHSALLGFIMVTGAHLFYATMFRETLLSFAIFQTLTMICFALSSSNFGAMAMEEMGHVAGSAASVQGFMVSLVGGGLIGLLIGQQFDGTVVPIVKGFLVFGILVLLSVLWTERGKLFQARNAKVGH